MLKLVNLSEQHVSINVAFHPAIVLPAKNSFYEFKDEAEVKPYSAKIADFMLLGLVELKEVVAELVVAQAAPKVRKAKDASVGDVQ